MLYFLRQFVKLLSILAGFELTTEGFAASGLQHVTNAPRKTMGMNSYLYFRRIF